MYPDTFYLQRNALDYIGFELEKGTIETEIAGKILPGSSGNLESLCSNWVKVFLA